METQWKGDSYIHRSQVGYLGTPLFLMLHRIRHCLQECQRKKMGMRQDGEEREDGVGNVETSRHLSIHWLRGSFYHQIQTSKKEKDQITAWFSSPKEAIKASARQRDEGRVAPESKLELLLNWSRQKEFTYTSKGTSSPHILVTKRIIHGGFQFILHHSLLNQCII